MRTRALLLTTSLLALTPPLAAQQVALATGPREVLHPIVVQAINAALLKPSYRMRLVSDWPQLSAGRLGCVNGGQEVLEGTLTQTGDASYTGRFRRKATIRFCGTHAGATEMCALTLTADGTVAARGTVALTRGDWTSPAIEFHWSTPEGASDAMVEGDCSAEFNAKVKALYLAASHSLEFNLPPAGIPRLTMPLDDYGWIVDVQ
jgi:hypothetical protein